MTFQGNPKPYTPPTHPATIIRYIMAVPYLSTAAPWLNLNCPGSSLSKKPNGNTATSTSSSFPPSPWHSPPTGQECPEGATLSHKQRRRGIPPAPCRKPYYTEAHPYKPVSVSLHLLDERFGIPRDDELLIGRDDEAAHGGIRRRDLPLHAMHQIFSSSTCTPRYSRLCSSSLRRCSWFSPIPAVNTMASSPPSAAMNPPIYLVI